MGVGSALSFLSRSKSQYVAFTRRPAVSMHHKVAETGGVKTLLYVPVISSINFEHEFVTANSMYTMTAGETSVLKALSVVSPRILEYALQDAYSPELNGKDTKGNIVQGGY